MIFQLILDFIFLIFILGEASFTGSAGTNYYVELEGEKTAMTGRFYFVWFVCVAAIQVFFCNYKTAAATCFIHAICAVFIYQYGHFIALDYEELGMENPGWWNTLHNISTLGNEPRGFVESEAIHWAIVEAVVVALVCLDAVLHILDLNMKRILKF